MNAGAQDTNDIWESEVPAVLGPWRSFAENAAWLPECTHLDVAKTDVKTVKTDRQSDTISSRDHSV